MPVAGNLTFEAYGFASQNAVNAHGPVAGVTRVRDRFGNLIYAKPGDYILKDEDGSLRVMPGALFEAEYTAVGAVTAPSNLLVSAQTLTGLTLGWTAGDAAALPHIEQDGVEIAINAAGVATKAVTGLTPNTGYSFRVRNRLNERFSAYLTPVTGFTLPATIVAAPVAGAVAATTIAITWVNADATALTEVHVDDGLGGAFVKFGASLAAGVTGVTITGLTASRTYRIRVRHQGALSLLVGAFSPTLTQATTA